MQKNDFEKQVQHQLEDFSILPGEAVWQKVAAKVQEDKKRKRILFLWLFAGIMLAGGAGLWISTNEPDNKISSFPINNEKPSANTQEQGNGFQVTDDSVKSGDDLEFTRKGNEAESNELHTQNSVQNAVKPGKRANTNAGAFETNEATMKKDVSAAKELPAKIKQQIKKVEDPATESETETSEIASVKPTDEPSTGKQKNTEVKVAENNEPILPTTSATNVLAIKKVANRTTKGLRIGATILGGFSDNVTSASFLPTNKSADRDLQFSSPIANQSSASQTAIPTYNYSSSYSWGAGVFAEQNISSKWAVSIGLNYKIMGANISVGTRVDSLKTFQDSILYKAETVSSFYRPGSNNKYRNVYHLLQIPVNMQLQLNRNLNKPISLSAGFAAGYLIGSNALYINEKNRVFYKEKDHFKRFLLSAQSGLAFTVFNDNKFQVQAGPYFQYQISNLTKTNVRTNEHLMFLGLKGNILFKKK